MKLRRFFSAIVNSSRDAAPQKKWELPNFIKPNSADDFSNMMTEWENAKNRFNEGAYSEAKRHITIAKEICRDLDGIIPLIYGTYQLDISKFEKEIISATIDQSSIENKFT